MKEYKVLKLEKKKNEYIVTFENDVKVSLSEDEIVEYRILPGASFSSANLSKFKKIQKQSDLYQKAIHYIDYKPRTIKEIKEYLLQKEASDDAIDLIIKKLIKINYLNDDRYAKSFVQEAIRKLKGKNYIERNLKEKGILDDIFNKYIDEYSDQEQRENAIKLVEKCQNTLDKYPIKKQKQKLSEKLYMEGYNFDIINYALSQVQLNDNSSSLLEKEYEKLILKEVDKSKIIQKLLLKGFDYQDIKNIIR